MGSAFRTRLCRLAMLTVLAACGGCSDPLLSPEEPRSQYDRYDALRAQRADGYEYDAFGRQRPNLRGRLLGKE